MPAFNTYKSSVTGKAQTLNRRAIRRAKYASAPLDTF